MDTTHRWHAVSGQSVRSVAERTADLLNTLAQEDAGPAQIEEVLRAHGESEPHLSRTDLRCLHRAAAQLRHVLRASTTEQAAERLNHLLTATAHPPRLTDHGGTTHWHLHLDSHDDAPWAEWAASSAGMCLALLLSDRQRPPGGVCAAHGCARIFIDTGSGSPRRHCSRRCATRARVAAHRAAPQNSASTATASTSTSWSS
ncbi:CGNR zinc finger domain-containing protein [Nocardiopsis xinjiangensis]|uniref:CGNR zinc finger domain-containing protein n=1 Tax=Nocardiopsis xinjiangensis TaxID=124285 RepID=UPI000347E973|nr:CGNR zinc finger domain-containing protein [Nocardiopsis xinjiangensis]